MILTLEDGSTVIHLVKDVKCERGSRKANMKCGAVVLDDADTRPTEWTAWACRTTCVPCRGE